MTVIETRRDLAGKLAAALEAADAATIKSQTTPTQSAVELLDLLYVAVQARREADRLWHEYSATFKTQET